MRLAIPKIRLAASVGIYLTDHAVSWCAVEKLPLRTRVVDQGEQPCTRGDWAIALNRVLEGVLPKIGGPNAAVIIGLPTSHTFYATLPTGAKVVSAEALLAGNHCCSSIPPTDLTADMVAVKVEGRQYAAVGAARRKELQIITDIPRKLEVRTIRVEPAPWALLRASSPAKSGKVSLRLFVADTHLLAILLGGTTPLLWRLVEGCDLREDTSQATILSLVRTFETYAVQQLGLHGMDSVVLEGPNIDAGLSQRLTSELGSDFKAVEGAGPTDAAVAKGLALGGLERDKPAPDLARTLAPPPRLWDLVPRGEVAMLLAIIICMSLWLYMQGTIEQNNARRAEEENARNPILKVEDSKLRDEKKGLTAEVGAVSSFMSNRIMWTEYLSELSSRLPRGVKLVILQADFELTAGTGLTDKKAKKGLVLSFTTTLARDMPAPPEVDQVLEAVRNTPVIARDFPEIKLTSLRINKSDGAHRATAANGDGATFVVSCTPRAAPKKEAAPAADGSNSSVAKTE